MFKVHELVDSRYRNNKKEYLVNWQGYPHYQDTWQPEENLSKVSDLIRKFQTKKIKKLFHHDDNYKKLCVQAISKNEKGEFIYQIIQDQQTKIVNRNYLMNGYMLELCQFYEENMQLIDYSALIEGNKNDDSISNDTRFSSEEIFNKIIKLTEEDLRKYCEYHPERYWSQKQDAYLWDKAKKGEEFKQIQQHLRSKSLQQCRQRYQLLRNLKQFPWKKQEEQLLNNIIKRQGCKWKRVTSVFNKQSPLQIYRSEQQIKQHCEPLRKNISNWDIEDDLMLIAMLKNIGTDWLKIQKIMNKDASKIKLRYQKKLKEVALKKTNEDNIK